MQNRFTLEQEIIQTKNELIFKNNCAQVAGQQVTLHKNQLRTDLREYGTAMLYAKAVFDIEAAVLQAKLRKLENELKKLEQVEDKPADGEVSLANLADGE